MRRFTLLVVVHV